MRRYIPLADLNRNKSTKKDWLPTETLLTEYARKNIEKLRF